MIVSATFHLEPTSSDRAGFHSKLGITQLVIQFPELWYLVKALGNQEWSPGADDKWSAHFWVDYVRGEAVVSLEMTPPLPSVRCIPLIIEMDKVPTIHELRLYVLANLLELPPEDTTSAEYQEVAEYKPPYLM